MNGFSHTSRRIGARCLIWLGPVIIGLVSASNRSEAAAIHHVHDSSAVDAASNQTWAEYLLGGPSVWSKVAHPALTAGIEAQMWKSIKSDPPPNTTAVVQFFEYRQSLDPARFDHYHPRIAASLAKIEAQGATPSTSATTPTATTTTGTPTDQAQQITAPSTDPASVPESPSTEPCLSPSPPRIT